MNPRPITFDQLVSFAAGEPARGDGPGLAARIEGDPAAMARVAHIRRVLRTMREDDFEVPPSWLSDRVRSMVLVARTPAWATWLARVRRVAASLTYDSRQTPALAGFRGSESDLRLTYEGDGWRVDLLAAPVDPDESTWRLRGQLASEDRGSAGPLLAMAAGTREPVLVVEPDQAGEFRAELRRGTYDLILGLEAETAAMVLPGLELG